MTSGGYTLEEAKALQSCTERKKCRHAESYRATHFPKCKPLCETCLNKWLDAQEKA